MTKRLIDAVGQYKEGLAHVGKMLTTITNRDTAVAANLKGSLESGRSTLQARLRELDEEAQKIVDDIAFYLSIKVGQHKSILSLQEYIKAQVEQINAQLADLEEEVSKGEGQ